MATISLWKILIVAVIVILLFGTKKLRGLGGDLGASLKGFKKEMGSDSDISDEKKPYELSVMQTENGNAKADAEFPKAGS